MGLRSEVEKALDAHKVEGWQREQILLMAQAMEDNPQASMAAQLRFSMDQVGAVMKPKPKVSPLDELRAKREERMRRASSSSERAAAE